MDDESPPGDSGWYAVRGEVATGGPYKTRHEATKATEDIFGNPHPGAWVWRKYEGEDQLRQKLQFERQRIRKLADLLSELASTYVFPSETVARISKAITSGDRRSRSVSSPFLTPPVVDRNRG